MSLLNPSSPRAIDPNTRTFRAPLLTIKDLLCPKAEGAAESTRDATSEKNAVFSSECPSTHSRARLAACRLFAQDIRHVGWLAMSEPSAILIGNSVRARSKSPLMPAHGF